MTDLHTLLASVEKAEGPDDALDRWLTGALVMGLDRPCAAGNDNPYTASIDSSIALVERMLPGWHWEVGRDGTAMVRDPNVVGASADYVCWGGTTPALALLAALLRALIAKGTEQ